VDLAKFLADRLDEDERDWRAGVEEGTHGDTPWRVERDGRELAAKRKILADLDLTYPDEEHLLRLLAAIYDGHPDFDPAWKENVDG
jgi:Family of unknown function (DUF6221)